jgi:hypothetical protein
VVWIGKSRLARTKRFRPAGLEYYVGLRKEEKKGRWKLTSASRWADREGIGRREEEERGEGSVWIIGGLSWICSDDAEH